MAEYIEREAAYEKCGWYNTVNGKSIYAVRKDELASLSAADVAPVRHARWVIPVTDEPWEKGCFGKCSSCQKVYNGFRRMPPYCPWCGSKMDLEVGE